MHQAGRGAEPWPADDTAQENNVQAPQLAQDAEISKDLEGGAALEGSGALVRQVVGQLVAVSREPDEDKDDAK